MYRNNIDNAVTYTPEDLDLFRESPFAVWMERLTLENPDHGILPDRSRTEPQAPGTSTDSMVETLRAEGRQVAAIETETEESERRAATLGAMRNGADFIVNGQLASGVFSGRAALLMRTSGYSELGDYLYIPCEPEAGDTFVSGYRLAFIANLLHNLQGQLPPQMLIIRDGADVVPLQTEDHIHYYLAVQTRFERSMGAFRKHRMPDPSESSHFGRWSDCASEVLKQRALRELSREEEAAEVDDEAHEQEQEREELALRVAAGVQGQRGAYTGGATRATDAVLSSTATEAGHTLAEQARMLDPGSFSVGAGPGHTPNLARFSRADVMAPASRGVETAPQELAEQEPDSTGPEAGLDNLEYIGGNGRRGASVWEALKTDTRGAPPPSLRRALKAAEPPESTDDADGELSGRPRFLPPDPPAARPAAAAEGPGNTHPGNGSLAGVDLDSAPAPSLAPTFEDLGAGTDGEDRELRQRRPGPRSGSEQAPPRPFDDRLNTSADFDDD